MKKTILTIMLALAAVAANAQVKAIGVNTGTNYEVSYQHYLGPNDNFIQADLGFGILSGYTAEMINFGQFNVVATYNFMCCRPEWTSKGYWGVFAGPGLYLGTPFVGKTTAVSYGIALHAGIEYTFDFPVQVSCSVRPMIGAVTANNYTEYHTAGLYGLLPTISIRYSF